VPGKGRVWFGHVGLSEVRRCVARSGLEWLRSVRCAEAGLVYAGYSWVRRGLDWRGKTC